MRRWKLFMAVCFMAVCMGGCSMWDAAQTSESVANMGQDTQTSESAANVAQNEKVDLSGMDPHAANEIMGTLDDINEQVLTDAQTGTEAVIWNTVHLMGVAVGNSLVEDQVSRVVKAWKQQKSESELQAFMAKYELVYEEYGILNSNQAEEELAKAQYKLADYDYCGTGQLDMVEWIKNSLEGND